MTCTVSVAKTLCDSRVVYVVLSWRQLTGVVWDLFKRSPKQLSPPSLGLPAGHRLGIFVNVWAYLGALSMFGWHQFTLVLKDNYPWDPPRFKFRHFEISRFPDPEISRL